MFLYSVISIRKIIRMYKAYDLDKCKNILVLFLWSCLAGTSHPPPKKNFFSQSFIILDFIQKIVNYK